MSTNRNFFQTKDTDESLQSKTGGSFGLNTGFYSLIAHNPNAGKDGAESDAVDINFKVKDREFRRRLYFSKDASYFGSDNNLINVGEEGHEDLYFADMVQKIAVLKHVLKSVGVQDSAIDAVSSTLDPDDLIGGILKLLALLPADYTQKQADLFLEWQWEIGRDQNTTFLEVPKNMKGGHFAVPHVAPVGSWKPVTDAEGELSYIDDSGNKHPFTRNANYMKSPRAYRQGEGATVPEANKPEAPSAQTAKASSWD